MQGEEAPGHFQCTTSGSTGAPRRIRRSMASWRANFETNTGLFGLSSSDRYATLGGLSHSLTLYAACEALHVGADLRLLDGMRPDRQAQALREDGTTVLYATPVQLRQLGEAPCPKLRLVLVGGGALDSATAGQVRAMAPNAALHVFYGASETSFISISDATTPEGSVGRAYPGVQVMIRDAQGAALPVGAEGEIWIETPTAFAGYAGGDTGSTRRDGAALTVGEHGYLDRDGHLWLTGRGDRVFQVADQKVHPEEIEAVLLALPGVTHAAVLPRRDTARGQVPIALVSGEIETESALIAARTALGPTKAPRAMIRVADWPLLPSGKTDLRALEALL
ncbi:AMP-binding protein [Mesobacterium pallidum]|uniref:AMP-binding protein n=1 Tax=Mesobacterium pallidum TaxID=2872037 RepID=UPI001EE2F250